jgi:death-on-curing protein
VARLASVILAQFASAVSQPKVSVGGQDAYPTLVEKAAALAYSLIRNHGFLDGNKRIAHAAMEVFLVMNDMEISASVSEQERFMLFLAAGDISRESLADWLRSNIIEIRREN